MKVTPLAIPEVLLIEPRVFGDHRGYFFETWGAAQFAKAGVPATFVQDNVSRSNRGTLRGLHLQNPHGQGKLVMVLTGTVFDVAVDVRRGSPTFGRWIGQELSEDNHRQLYIPPGFAHGFCVVSEVAHFAYKCTDGYHPEAECSVRYDDPDLGIAWPKLEYALSPKDAAASRLAEIDSARLPSY